MRYRLNLLAAGGMVMLLAACSTDRSLSPGNREVSASLSAANVDTAYVRWLGDALFGGHSGAMNQLGQMINSQPATPARINGGLNVIERLMEWLEAGTLLDPPGDLTAQSGALVLMNMVNAYIGRDDLVVPLPDDLNDLVDYAIHVVGPETDETILTNLEDAGVKITPGTFQARTVLSIIRQDDRELDPPHTPRSPVFDVTLTPMVEFEPFTLGICANQHLSPGQLAKALIYHYSESTGEYDALVRVTPPTTLVCEHTASSYRSRDGIGGWLASLSRTVSRVITPKTLYAGHAAIAGTVKDLSPFVVGAPDQLETELSLTLPDPSLIFGMDAPISATLTADGSPVAGESIALTVDGASQSPATTSSLGVADWSYGQPRVGDIPVAAAFAETDGYLGSAAAGTLRVRYTTSPGRVFTTPLPNSQYALNRTVPFKFQLFQWTPTGYVNYMGATATLKACRVVGGSCNAVSLPTGAATAFRTSDGQYILNFEAKLLPATGIYRFSAALDDLTDLGPVQITIK
jgi:hypothetical protein